MEKKTFKKIFIMMLLMIFTLSPLTSFAEPVINGGTIVVKKVEEPATPTNPEADPTKKDDKEGDKAKEKKSSDDNSQDTSFYKISSAASTFYEELHNPQSKKEKDGKGSASGSVNGIDVSTAGSLIGFKDEDFDGNAIGATLSKLSYSAQSRGYQSVANRPGEEGIYAYMVYGHALSQLGLDSSVNPNFALMSTIIRAIAGIVFAIFFLLASIVDFIMDAAIKVMKFLSPFYWLLGDASYRDSVTYTRDVPSQLKPLQEFVSGIYTTLRDNSFIVIAMSLTFLIFYWIIRGRSGDNMSRLRRFLTRTMFLLVGVPLLLSTYELGINWLSNFRASQTVNANYITARTFMDFENWAKKYNLALFNDTTISVRTDKNVSGDVTADTNPRKIALSVNRHITGKDMGFDYENSFNKSDKNTLNPSNFQKDFQNGLDIIGRYIKGSYYTASSYETDMRSKISADEMAETVEQLGDKDNWAEGDFLTGRQGKWISNNGGDGLTLGSYNNAGASSGLTFNPGGRTNNEVANLGMADPSVKISDKKGLSTLAMYNYLNSTFDDANVTTYSSNKASSDIVRNKHRSVNLVGNGIMKLFYYFEAISLFAVVAVLGLGYTISMLFNNIMRSVRMFTTLPGAMIGSLRGMARFTTIVIMMFVEVFMTLIAYSLLSQFFMSMNSVVTNIITTDLFGSEAVPAVIGGIPMAGGLIVEALCIIFVIVLNLVFAKKALQFRGSLVKAMDDGIAEAIDKFFMTSQYGSAVNTSKEYAQPGEQVADKVRTGAKVLAGGIIGGKVLSSVAGAVMGDKLRGDKDDKDKKDGKDGKGKDKKKKNNATAGFDKQLKALAEGDQDDKEGKLNTLALGEASNKDEDDIDDNLDRDGNAKTLAKYDSLEDIKKDKDIEDGKNKLHSQDEFDENGRLKPKKDLNKVVDNDGNIDSNNTTKKDNKSDIKGLDENKDNQDDQDSKDVNKKSKVNLRESQETNKTKAGLDKSLDEDKDNQDIKDKDDSKDVTKRNSKNIREADDIKKAKDNKELNNDFGDDFELVDSNDSKNALRHKDININDDKHVIDSPDDKTSFDGNDSDDTHLTKSANATKTVEANKDGESGDLESTSETKQQTKDINVQSNSKFKKLSDIKGMIPLINEDESNLAPNGESHLDNDFNPFGDASSKRISANADVKRDTKTNSEDRVTKGSHTKFGDIGNFNKASDSADMAQESTRKVKNDVREAVESNVKADTSASSNVGATKEVTGNVSTTKNVRASNVDRVQRTNRVEDSGLQNRSTMRTSSDNDGNISTTRNLRQSNVDRVQRTNRMEDSGSTQNTSTMRVGSDRDGNFSTTRNLRASNVDRVQRTNRVEDSGNLQSTSTMRTRQGNDGNINTTRNLRASNVDRVRRSNRVEDSGSLQGTSTFRPRADRDENINSTRVVRDNVNTRFVRNTNNQNVADRNSGFTDSNVDKVQYSNLRTNRVIKETTNNTFANGSRRGRSNLNNVVDNKNMHRTVNNTVTTDVNNNEMTRGANHKVNSGRKSKKFRFKL